jgi:predicted acylesterase/phospholipase RssA
VENWDPALDHHIAEYISRVVAEKREEYGAQAFPFQVLAISGGGARGAYGAGLLTGWTAAGTRPEFDVVTGISTGALMATSAFLGSEEDEFLEIHTQTVNEDIYERRGRLRGVLSDALYDTAPLRARLAQSIDEEVLAAVAREDERGRRLYIGTTNLDANVFTIWDMGAIAASERPERLERYRDVVLASASMPGLFPPVYIPVDVGGRRYFQMHADGGVRRTIFVYDLVDNADEALAVHGLERKDFEFHIYVLHNGRLYARTQNKPVRGRSLEIAGAAIAGLLRQNRLTSLYRLWVAALVEGASFHLAHIPDDMELSDNPVNFDQAEMRRLFDLGYQQALNGDAWQTQPPVTDPAEMMFLVNPRHTLDELEARPWLRRWADTKIGQ